MNGSDLVMDVLTKGSTGIEKVLETVLTIVIDDYARQSHSCRLAVVAKLLSSWYTTEHNEIIFRSKTAVYIQTP